MSLLGPLSTLELSNLKDRTIIVTGGASGIGAAACQLAHAHGANVFIADVQVKAGKALQESLGTPRAVFHETDVSSWPSVLSLFETAFEKFSRIDVVCANAGIAGAWDDLLGDAIDTDGQLAAPQLRLMDVNLTGVLYTVKTAVHWFGKQQQQQRADDGKKHQHRFQLVLTGSAASFLDTPPLYLYCAAKTGVLGLMRGLRTQLPRQRISVNMVAPWMTVTPMLPQSIEHLWATPYQLPANTPEGVAHALLLPAVRPETNGASLFVAGNQIVDVEGKLHECQRVWLGEKLSVDVDEGQRRLIPEGELGFGGK